MKKNVNKAFNAQINREFFSAYLYLAMAEWLQQHGWIGASKWMVVQYKEEIQHAEGLIRWMQQHDGQFEMEAIEKPKAEFDSLLNVFKESLAHEQFITENIYELVDISAKEGDKASVKFLDWYVMEQSEEEDNARNNILGVEMCGDDISALLDFDRVLGEREFGTEEIPYLE